MAVNWANFQAKRGVTPVYVQLANFIQAEIEAGRLEPGDQLPSQRDMRELTGHSMEVAAHAMAVLRDRGLVETAIAGTFVKEP